MRIRTTILALVAVGAVVASSFLFQTTPSNARTPSFGRLSIAESRPPPLAVILPPTRVGDNPLPELPATKGYVILDVASGKPLLANDPDRQYSLASITKLATALVVLSTYPVWQERVTIVPEDEREGSEPILIPGETVTREELWNASLVGSSNIATAALARSTGLTAERFVARMNRIAETLGLHQTHFVEPTGLDDRNVSTARETAFLARAALGDLRIRRAVLTPAITLHPMPSKSPKARIVKSTDALLFSDLIAAPYAFHGGKTGSVGVIGGFNFVMMLGNGQKRDLIISVLGADTAYARFEAARSLALWAFKTHRWK